MILPHLAHARASYVLENVVPQFVAADSLASACRDEPQMNAATLTRPRGASGKVDLFSLSPPGPSGRWAIVFDIAPATEIHYSLHLSFADLHARPYADEDAWTLRTS